MSRDREREKKRDQEDEEEAYERRKLERKLRDKEAAYQEVRDAGRSPFCSFCTCIDANFLTVVQYNHKTLQEC